jgi:uncharacterized membrane protein YeiH
MVRLKAMLLYTPLFMVIASAFLGLHTALTGGDVDDIVGAYCLVWSVYRSWPLVVGGLHVIFGASQTYPIHWKTVLVSAELGMIIFAFAFTFSGIATDGENN